MLKALGVWGCCRFFERLGFRVQDQSCQVRCQSVVLRVMCPGVSGELGFRVQDRFPGGECQKIASKSLQSAPRPPKHLQVRGVGSHPKTPSKP